MSFAARIREGSSMGTTDALKVSSWGGASPGGKRMGPMWRCRPARTSGAWPVVFHDAGSITSTSIPTSPAYPLSVEGLGFSNRRTRTSEPSLLLWQARKNATTAGALVVVVAVADEDVGLMSAWDPPHPVVT